MITVTMKEREAKTADKKNAAIGSSSNKGISNSTCVNNTNTDSTSQVVTTNNYDNIPVEMQGQRRWLSATSAGGSKRVCDEHGDVGVTGLRKNDALLTFEQASQRLEHPAITSMGWVLGGDSQIVCIDIDKMINATTGENNYSCVQAILDDFPDAYVEWSTSKRGLHLFVPTNIPIAELKSAYKSIKGDDRYLIDGKENEAESQIELYIKNQFILLTGNLYRPFDKIEGNDVRLQYWIDKLIAEGVTSTGALISHAPEAIRNYNNLVAANDGYIDVIKPLDMKAFGLPYDIIETVKTATTDRIKVLKKLVQEMHTIKPYCYAEMLDVMCDSANAVSSKVRIDDNSKGDRPRRINSAPSWAWKYLIGNTLCFDDFDIITDAEFEVYQRELAERIAKIKINAINSANELFQSIDSTVKLRACIESLPEVVRDDEHILSEVKQLFNKRYKEVSLTKTKLKDKELNSLFKKAFSTDEMRAMLKDGEPSGISMTGFAKAFVNDNLGTLECDRNGNVFNYDGVNWREQTKPELNAMIYRFNDKQDYGLDLEVRDYNTIAVNACSEISPKKIDWDNSGESINTKTGLLTFTDEAWVLEPHKPEHYMTNHLNIKYKPDAPTPNRWLSFEQECFPDDDDMKLLLRQMIGYCFLQDCSLETFFILIGAAGNGKGVISNVIKDLLGEGRYRTFSPQQLTDKHTIAEIRGAYANIVTETKENATLPDALLKALVSGEEMDANIKNGKIVTHKPFATLIFSANEGLKLHSGGDAIKRRTRILAFNYRPCVVDTRLGDKLRAERDGITKLVLDALGIALAFNDKGERGIVKPKLSTDRLDEWLEDVDDFKQFVLNDFNPHGEIHANAFYKLYLLWCDDNNTPIKDRMTKTGLSRKLKQPTYREFISIKRKENGTYYVGISAFGEILSYDNYENYLALKAEQLCF